MKKKLLIILFIFLVSGCTAEYNLTIEDDNFIESIDISAPIDKKDELNYFVENEQLIKSSISSNVIYNREVSDYDDKAVVNLYHKFSLNEYNESTANKCFENFKIMEEDDYYTIVADKFNCYGGFEASAEKYIINIKTNYNVLNNNADSVKNNVYTWNIDKKNHEKKSIIFQFSKKEKEFDFINFIKPIGISFLVAVSIIVVGYIVYNYRKRQRMEM